MMTFFQPHKIAAGVLALFVTAVIGFGEINEVEAGFWCEFGISGVDWSIPEDGATTTSDTHILVVLHEMFEPVDVTVTDSDDIEVEGETTAVEMGHRKSVFGTGVIEFVPDEPLAGGEYSVIVDLETPVEFVFTVDEILEAPDAPEAVEFQWFRESQDKGQEDECGGAEAELQYIAIEPLEDEPDYYEIVVEDGDGSETLQLVPGDAHDGELRSYTISDAACVSVAARLNNGVSGEVTQYCEPHKCMHYQVDGDAESAGALGSTDWSALSGCEEVAENSESGGEEGCGSCTASPGSVPPLSMILLIALGLLLRQRR